jgi:hypothetical protein
MIILQESASSQTLRFMPRSFTSGATYNIKIVDELTKAETYNSNGTLTENLYYYTYSDTFNTKQNKFYEFTVTQSGEVVYKDKIFCTNQTTTTYTVNENEYTQHASTDEFITI